MSLNAHFKIRKDGFIFEKAFQIIIDNNLEKEHFFMFIILENMPTRFEYFFGKKKNSHSQIYFKNSTDEMMKPIKFNGNEITYLLESQSVVNNFFIDEINQSIEKENYDGVLYLDLPIYGRTRLRFISAKIECKSTLLIVNLSKLNPISSKEPLKLVLKYMETQNNLTLNEKKIINDIYLDITGVELDFNLNMNDYIKLLNIIEV
jgi:hypothetical protein